jgi:hypothetical protein
MTAALAVATPTDARPAETPRRAAPIVRWSGRPAWRSCAIRIWRAPWVAVYFGLLLADAVRASVMTPLKSDLLGDAALLGIAIGVLGLLALLAWLTARTTTYILTDRHVEMHFGIGLQAKLVIPFGAIEHVAVRVHSDQTGDIALRLIKGQGVLYPKLWPHARPWRWFRAEPMLRCVPRAGVVGTLLSRAVAAEAAAHARGTILAQA